ncbi:MAG: hypothetical protein OXB97_08220 [Rhodospirillales bacterium]|nr:hypothetical protein [Rhodospirillales bacterium]
MTKRQKLAIEASEKRQRLNELLALDELTDEQRGELDTLTKRMQQIEVETRAAITAEAADEAEARGLFGNNGDGEPAEIRALRGKVRTGGYVTAALEQRAAAGAEAEYNAAIKLPGNKFPMSLLAPPEERAATAVDTQTMPRRWLDRLFADTAAMRIGVTMESVADGVASYPITTAGASAAQRAKSQAAADAAWTIGVSELKPTRNTVRLVFNTEDEARVPMLEEALNRDLRMALTEGVDRAIFLGDAGATGTDADIVGFSTATITEHEITQAEKVTAAGSLAPFMAMVDGIHATMVEDLRCVLAVGALRLWGSTIANAAAENETVLQFLKANGLTCTSRGEIETATLNGDFAAFVGRGRGIEGAAVAPTWEGGQLIRDMYSGAAKGEVALTLVYLWNFGIVRTANFQRVKFVT